VIGGSKDEMVLRDSAKLDEVADKLKKNADKK
jgi:hypothetical protein